MSVSNFLFSFLFLIFNQNTKNMKKIDLTIENIKDIINDMSFKKNLLILEDKKEELEICESILNKLEKSYEQR